MAWTDERITLLKRYWEEGLSASQIAELLGDGLSRNAVIGKAHRLGLASRPSPLKPAKGEAKAAREAKADAPKAERAKPARKTAAEASPPKADEPGATEKRAEPARAEPVARPAPKPAPAPVAAEPVARAPQPQPQAEPAPRPVTAAPAAVTEAAVRRPAATKGARRVSLLDLNDRICKWPIGHPDEADFHFCGQPVNPGFPYCGEHCLVAYQAQMPRRDRPGGGGPPRPFGPNLPRPR